MCDIVFEKVQGCAGKVNRTSVYAEAAFRRVPIKGFMRYFPEFTKKHQCRNLFFDKVKLSRSKNFIKIESLEQVFAKFEKFVGTPFSQSTTGRLLLITSEV